MNPSGNPGLVAVWVSDRARACAYIAKHLRHTGGNVRDAARLLKVNRRTLHRWILQEKVLAKACEEHRETSRAKRKRTESRA